jgi:hypothetical protein
MRRACWPWLLLACCSCVGERYTPETKPANSAEYFCFAEHEPERAAQKLNLAARQGWKLVAAAGADRPTWCLTRSARKPE